MKFWVAGEPIPQGSMRYIGQRVGADGKSRAVLVHTRDALPRWREEIGKAAKIAGLRPEHGEGGVYLALEFWITRPPSVPKKRKEPWARPDLDKLCRAALDGLTGIGYIDDGRVVRLIADKLYAGERGPGLEVRYYRMAERS